MLEHSLAEDHAAGAHMERPATGAGWAFLLPSLSLRSAVCFGAPTPAAAATLERICAQVVVLRSAEQVHHALAELDERVVDLVTVCSRRVARRLLRDPRAVTALQGALSPRAAVYEEGFGEPPRGRVASALGVHGGSVVTWLTPAFGEVRTAAPGYSSEAAAWLRSQGLDRGAIDERILIGLRRRYRARVRPAVAPATPVESGAQERSPDGARANGVTAARLRVAGLLHVAGRAEARLARSSSLGRRGGRLTGEGVTGLPSYVRRLAATAEVDLAGHGWALVAPGDYENQKVLFFTFAPGATEPDLVVKLARSETASVRLDRAAAALATLQSWPDLARDTVPTVAFSGRHEDFAICAESAVSGVSFQEGTSGTADCPLVGEALEWLARLGTESARPMPASEAAHAMRTIVERLELAYDMSPRHLELLRAQCDEIAGARELPAVFAHGDPGTWNLVAKRGGGVVFLDWENAEPTAPPLWDLFYLLRSYATLVARRAGSHDRHSAATSTFLRPGPLLPLLESSIESYCSHVRVDRSLVTPLFHMCWAMHAARAAIRLSAWDRERGAHISFLRRMIDESANPTLQAILQGSAS